MIKTTEMKGIPIELHQATESVGLVYPLKKKKKKNFSSVCIMLSILTNIPGACLVV